MRKILGLTVILALSASLCWAETVYLKNGKKISGKIIQQDDQQIKLDVSGVKVTYFKDEIDRVEGAAAAAPASEPSQPAQPPQATPEPVVPSIPTPAPESQPYAPAGEPATLPTPSLTPQAKKDLILNLIDVSGTRSSMEAMFEQIVAEAPPEEQSKLKEVFNLDEIIDRFIPVYDKYFTDDDLNQLVNFYKSPVGKKLIKVTPLLMEDSMNVSIEYFREKMPEPPASMAPGTGAGTEAPTTP